MVWTCIHAYGGEWVKSRFLHYDLNVMGIAMAKEWENLDLIYGAVFNPFSVKAKNAW